MPRGADLGQIYVGIFLPTPRAESVEPNFRTKFSRYATQSASKFCQIPPPPPRTFSSELDESENPHAPCRRHCCSSYLLGVGLHVLYLFFFIFLANSTSVYYSCAMPSTEYIPYQYAVVSMPYSDNTIDDYYMIEKQALLVYALCFSFAITLVPEPVVRAINLHAGRL